jgi:hypothetical protein
VTGRAECTEQHEKCLQEPATRTKVLLRASDRTSRYAPENNAYGATGGRLAMQAWRLNARARGATGPRARMLSGLAQVYVAWGLAKVHAEHESPEAPGLLQNAAETLQQLRTSARSRQEPQ